jgi:hypothetical protein
MPNFCKEDFFSRQKKLAYGLLDGLLVAEELHGDHRLHVLVQLVHERDPYTVSKLHKLSWYTVKKVIDFPVPRLDVTNQTLPGQELFNYSYCRPGRVWGRREAGDGKIDNHILQNLY